MAARLLPQELIHSLHKQEPGWAPRDAGGNRDTIPDRDALFPPRVGLGQREGRAQEIQGALEAEPQRISRSLSGEICQETTGFLGEGMACAKVQRWEGPGQEFWGGLNYKAE